ncbi:MAG: BACON domain-containing protein [Bacteroidales bacterium]|nr:BACON domain-containing protein [Bacteroidales bacterium]
MKKIILFFSALVLLASCDVKLPDTIDFAVTPEKATIGTDGGQVAISVYSNGAISVALDKDCAWARLTSPASFSGDGDVEIEVEANTSAKRTTNVTIVYKNGVAQKVVQLSQDGLKAFLELSTDELRIDATKPASSEVEIRTNVADALTVGVECQAEQNDWISDLQVVDGKLTFSTPAGFDTPQPALVTVSYEDAVVGKLSAKLNVLLSDKDGYFEAGPHTEIRTARELVKFLLDASTLESDAAYSITADIDMAGETYVPADDFKGTLVANGHKIKNLNAVLPLFKELSGSISDLVIDSSCTLSMDKNSDQAFIVGLNKGTVRSCVNNGKIQSPTKFVFDASKSVAGLVAVNKGVVVSCTNNGSLDVVSEAFYKNPVWLGGVVGKTSGAAGEASVKECINNGAVALTVDRCKSAVFVGGVVGGTPADTVQVQYSIETLKDYGTLTGCTNTGSVKVTYVENTNPMLNANVGGVISYLQGSISSCENKGDVSFSTSKTGDNTMNHLAFGGVAGFVLKSVSRCANTGSLTIEGLLGGGTVGDCGSSYYPGTLIGGVVGLVGTNDGNNVVEDCTNGGTLSMNGNMKPLGKPIFMVGGLVGYAKAPLVNCKNTANVLVRSNAKNKYVGGIAGQSCFNVESCDNSGRVEVDNVVVADENDYSLVTYLGGISGYHAVDAISKKISLCNNSGEVKYLNGPKGNTSINYVGGIAGISLGEIHGGTKESRSVNSGKLTYSGSTRCYLGGICGYSAAKILWMDNTGDVYAPGANGEGIADKSMVGGFIGVATHGIKMSLDGGASVTYGAGGKKAGYTGSMTADVSVKLQSDATSTGCALVFGKVNAAGGGANAYVNYHSAVISGNLEVSGASNSLQAILAGAGFGNYNSAPVGIISGIESGHLVLKAPIKINGTVITADNYKNYLAAGSAPENVVTDYTDYEN